MCGIAGIHSERRESLPQAIRLMKHRGPDAEVVVDYPEYGLALGHLRLSIIDLDARSDQPFTSPDGRFALVYNGEIYNYIELKKKLEDRGVGFHTTSDTEVLLQWLIAHGPDGLADLDGMYAFALFDKKEKTLLLARDQIGEKPLYYSNHGGEFCFASEIKGLSVFKGPDFSLDERGVTDYLRFLYTAPPYTFYKSVRELPPGHHLKYSLETRNLTVRRFFDLEKSIEEAEPLSYEDSLSCFRDAFVDSVKLRLRSDVPVGLFLSGGLDSNALAAGSRLVSQQAELRAFTAEYTGSNTARRFDESGIAVEAAKFHRFPIEKLQVPGEMGALQDCTTRVLDLFDQPFGNSTALVADRLASLAVRDCKVCLVGDGGDEILAGYPRHKALLLHSRFEHLPGPMKALVHAAAGRLPEDGRFSTLIRRMKYFTEGFDKPSATCFLEWSTYATTSELNTALGRDSRSEFFHGLEETFIRHDGDLLRAAALVDLKSFVPLNLMQSADRTGMAHSLEFRSPFLSTRLIRESFRIPSKYKVHWKRTKPLLVDSLGETLPPIVRNQPKRAFNPPVQVFIRANLDAIETRLTGSGSETSRLVNPEFLASQLDSFRRKRTDNSTYIWGLYVLEEWLRRGGRPRA